MIIRFLFAFPMMFMLHGCGQATIDSPSRLFSVDKEEGSWVIFEGRWKQLHNTGLTVIPITNTVKAVCYRLSSLCHETVAKLWLPKDSNALVHNYLTVENTEFKVVEWTDAKITATAEGRSVDLKLEVSLADSSAQRSSTETRARGNETANPNISRHWVLE